MLNNGNIRQAQLDDGVTPRVVIGTLYFAREVLVPTALALLLSFVLAPLVRTLRNWCVPHSIAVIASVLIAFVRGCAGKPDPIGVGFLLPVFVRGLVRLLLLLLLSIFLLR